MTDLANETIHEEVKARYGRIAETFTPEAQAQDDWLAPENKAGCCSSDSAAVADCCSSDSAAVADYFGPDLYAVDTSALPSDVTGLSLGCGDPISIAALEPGQTVLDLGSGGGIDCFLAAERVGDGGQVIGVDMTESMLEKANRNKAKMNADNVEFRQGHIEELPVADDSVDVILSNCVINLSPDKPAVFREAFRVLKPGGKVAISDMVTQGQFTAEERADVSAWAGCTSGAEDIADYAAWMREAGFSSVSIRDKAQPEIELADEPRFYGAARLFSARITAIK